jgi:prolyl 4-hydroxylase
MFFFSLQISDDRIKNLKCRYVNHSPLLRIAPVKEEQVFDVPAIWVYHDVITEKQIELMKAMGSPKVFIFLI